MIEFSQPAQCLFCPQRRKIALLFKLVLAGSTAIIVALILFLPPNGRAGRRQNTSREIAPADHSGVHVLAQAPPNLQRPLPQDAVSSRSAEILKLEQERFEAVQAQIRSLLNQGKMQIDRAQQLLDERRKEVLKTKVLTLGDGLFSGSRAAEVEKKLVLEDLEKQLAILAEQKRLLGELKGDN